MTASAIRAVRNCNPLNIERNAKNKWQGLVPESEMTPEQAAEKRYEVFRSPVWGFRAGAILMIAYQDRNDIDTIAGVVRKWAPPIENDAGAYINAVCKQTGFGPAVALNFHSYDHIAPVIKAMSIHEGGGWRFSDRDLDAGLTKAGIDLPVKAIAQSRTIKTATASVGTSLALGGVTEIADQLAPAMSIVRELREYAPYIALTVLLVAIAAIVWFRLDDYLRSKR